MKIRLADIFGDSMVLQRGINIPIWGSAPKSLAGEIITVVVNGIDSATTVDEEGAWRATLPPMLAGGPYSLTVCLAGKSQPECTLKDVLIGDVWLASGQSNMDITLAQSENAQSGVESANYPNIRLLKVPPLAQKEPRTEIQASWTACAPETVADFSAVAYYFGRELHRSVGVPIGIIQSSLGGTPAEAWTGREALVSDPGFAEVVADYELELAKPKESKRYLEAQGWKDKYDRPDEINEGYKQGWHLPDTNIEKWGSMRLPSYWRDQGENYSGIFWFCLDVDVPESWQGENATLNLGFIDKSDVTYVNGEQVGSVTMSDREDAWCTHRSYTVPKHLLKQGCNRISVRVHSNFAAGGIWGEPEGLSLETSKPNVRQSIPLSGDWKFQVEANFGIVPRQPTGPLGDGNTHSPHILFDCMIQPLIPYAIRGAIWYQGESNAERPLEYRRLFPLMIRSWRDSWQQGDFPFYFVQLANYIANEKWAELREAQAMALALPNTGMATAIDIGDPSDIHPLNKKDVGRRLALHALANEYAFQGLVASGPVARSATRDVSQVIIHFDSCGGGLKAKNELLGFELSSNHSEWHAADASLQGDLVVVECGPLKQAKWVRYAWSDNPICSLYNASDLPATPFKLQIED